MNTPWPRASPPGPFSPRPIHDSDPRGCCLRFATLLATSVLLAASPLHAQGTASPPAAMGAKSAPDPAAAPAEPVAASRSKLNPGSKAPDFQYQSYDALWQNLHNVLEHGDVLLLFGASDVDLRTLEREREVLVRGRVTPLAVVERNDREVWASVRRLGLTFSLLADPRGVIGAQYGVFDPSLGRSQAAWFVIDAKGRIRQMGGTMPSQSWPVVTATALGRPVVGSTQGAATR